MSGSLTIAAIHPSGFEVCLQVSSLEALEAIIDDLLKRGYRPARTGDIWQRTPEGLPMCPKHKVPMPTREKQGDTWYSHRVINSGTGEELYCRGYKGPSSPGWELPVER